MNTCSIGSLLLAERPHEIIEIIKLSSACKPSSLIRLPVSKTVFLVLLGVDYKVRKEEGTDENLDCIKHSYINTPNTSSDI